MKKRPISFDQAKARYPHRYTMEHVPQWAMKPKEDGTYYAPQYSTDLEWYENTLFKGEHELADDGFCYSSNQTWPLGKSLVNVFNKRVNK